MTAPHPEPLQLVLEAPLPSAARSSYEPSHELRAWIARRRRERAGLPLTMADREQISRQMEDL